ncbi:Integrase core domain-containing protein [Thermoactinomyces sp. DSM 45892]|nr:Integrase core domain-containing protein [Thermoactinomyces sp. DSM 45892]
MGKQCKRDLSRSSVCYCLGSKAIPSPHSATRNGERYFKKGYDHIRQEISPTKLAYFVKSQNRSYPLPTVCEVLGLRSVVLKKYRPFRSDRKIYQGGQDLLKRDFHSSKRNEKWVSDITYVHTSRDGWCYLASIMDLATNKIVGWHFSKTMDKECVLQALDHAIVTQKPAKGCILHSDRGSQYTSNKYRHTVNTNGFKQSFSAKGCPYDNAPIESFHAIFKKEFVYPSYTPTRMLGFGFLNLLRAAIIEIVSTVGLVTKPHNKWRISSIHM